MRNLILLCFLATFISCSKYTSEINFEIQNNSEKSLSNIKFFTSEKKEVLTFGELKSGQAENGTLSMKENKSDGHYILEFTNANGDIKRYSKGYYSNGKPQNGNVLFEIQNDSVLSHFK